MKNNPEQKHTVYVIELEDDLNNKLIRPCEYTVERTLTEYENLILNQNRKVTGRFYFLSKDTRKQFLNCIDFINEFIIAENYTMGAYLSVNHMLHSLDYFCKSACLFDLFNIEYDYKLYDIVDEGGFNIKFVRRNNITKENNNEQ